MAKTVDDKARELLPRRKDCNNKGVDDKRSDVDKTAKLRCYIGPGATTARTTRPESPERR